MLNKDDEATAHATDGDEEAGTATTVLKMNPIMMGRNLDDPNSLWERPILLYVVAMNLHKVLFCW